MDGSNIVSPATIAWLGAGLGVAFGFVGQRSNFCTMGAVSDIVAMGSWTRMRMWLMAIGAAILATGALQLAGLIDVSKSIYTSGRILWVANLVGGALFGIGMTLAGGCGSKTLIRLGGGNLKSVVVFAFVAIAAYMTLKGLFGVWRVRWLEPWVWNVGAGQDLPTLLAGTFGLSARTLLMVLVALIGGGLVAFALADRDFRRPEPLLGGLLTGLFVATGWYISGHVGYLAEHPETLQEAFVATNSGRAESLSFIAPYAYTLELLMMWSDTSRIVTFGIATALGVVGGAALGALTSGSFRVEGFRQTEDLARHIIGAILMGMGGVTAMGCTIGQGVTGLSTLSIGAFLTFSAIIAGCVATLKWEYARAMRD
jgi:hypothetical protein